MDKLMGWRTAYTISNDRESTKRGSDHLTKNALNVLMARKERDEELMVAAMMRGMFLSIVRE